MSWAKRHMSGGVGEYRSGTLTSCGSGSWVGVCNPHGCSGARDLAAVVWGWKPWGAKEAPGMKPKGRLRHGGVQLSAADNPASVGDRGGPRRGFEWRCHGFSGPHSPTQDRGRGPVKAGGWGGPFPRPGATPNAACWYGRWGLVRRLGSGQRWCGAAPSPAWGGILGCSAQRLPRHNAGLRGGVRGAGPVGGRCP